MKGYAQVTQGFHSGKSYSSLGSMTAADDIFFFVLSDDDYGLELWRSDGTSEGTTRIKDINPGPLGSIPSDLLLVNNILFFTADDGTHGRELWRSDGTLSGTVMLSDITKGSGSTTINFLHAKDGQLFFQVENEDHFDTWTTDGSTDGTERMEGLDQATMVLDEKEITIPKLPSRFSSISSNQLVRMKEQIYFNAEGLNRGRELWRSDGTGSGTLLVKDIHPGKGESYITEMTAIGDCLYFSAYDGIHGSELWKSDGTAAGTEMVCDILIGSNSSLPRNFTAFKEKVYFSIAGEYGIELWMTDGSADGTQAVFPVREPITLTTHKARLQYLDFPAAVLTSRDGEMLAGEESLQGHHTLRNNLNTFYLPLSFAADDNNALSLCDVTGRVLSRSNGNYIVRIRARKYSDAILVTAAD
jgi:ELWxxDGT repeat protein